MEDDHRVELDTMLEEAKERGRVWIEEFSRKPHWEQIEALAQSLYYAIEHDPYGYPNGRPSWDEIPDVDSNHMVGTDKARYLYAAEQAHNAFRYMK